MSKSTIVSCDICKKQTLKYEEITMPLTKTLQEVREHKYEDSYEFVKKPSYSNVKKIDICHCCLGKIFETFGIVKEGNLV